MKNALRAPFPWFGGKSRAAPIVWAAFGNVPNYIEPFFGSGAVLLGRPGGAGKTETVNDADCYLANFWRAISAAPSEVAKFTDWPVNETDMEARHQWLVSQTEFRHRMKCEPDYFDARIAGWWVWGLCGWIGSGWCSAYQDGDGNAGMGIHRKLPHLGNAGMGIHRKLPHLGDAGMGIHRQLPHLGDAGRGVDIEGSTTSVTLVGASIDAYFRRLADRFRRVRVACGDWSRVLGNSVTWRHGTTGIFLDPPYDDGELTYSAGGSGVAADVRAWCEEHGKDKRLRIALCGYDGDPEPAGWRCVPWKAKGGYGSQRADGSNENAKRERVWLSPHCDGGAATDPLFARVK